MSATTFPTPTAVPPLGRHAAIVGSVLLLSMAAFIVAKSRKHKNEQ